MAQAMAHKVPTIAIDGPGGSGKGTVSQLVADALGWNYLDSGALYRLVGLQAVYRGIDLADAAAVTVIAETLDAAFETGAGELTVRLEGADVTAELRTEVAGEYASRVAAINGVRKALLGRQRRFATPPGLVADGRDMGTVVFPDAELKIFLTASVEERARRRYNQLKDKGQSGSLAQLEDDIQRRDERDASRAFSPLVAADDAVVVDSTNMSIEEVKQRVLAEAGKRGLL